ncbi:MAG: hypothetical protein ACXWL2_02315 [Candidatus Chromulinivorax sp.]
MCFQKSIISLLILYSIDFHGSFQKSLLHENLKNISKINVEQKRNFVDAIFFLATVASGSYVLDNVANAPAVMPTLLGGYAATQVQYAWYAHQLPKKVDELEKKLQLLSSPIKLSDQAKKNLLERSYDRAIDKMALENKFGHYAVAGVSLLGASITAGVGDFTLLQTCQHAATTALACKSVYWSVANVDKIRFHKYMHKKFENVLYDADDRVNFLDSIDKKWTVDEIIKSLKEEASKK